MISGSCKRVLCPLLFQLAMSGVVRTKGRLPSLYSHCLGMSAIHLQSERLPWGRLSTSFALYPHTTATPATGTKFIREMYPPRKHDSTVPRLSDATRNILSHEELFVTRDDCLRVTQVHPLPKHRDYRRRNPARPRCLMLLHEHSQDLLMSSTERCCQTVPVRAVPHTWRTCRPHIRRRPYV